MEGRDLEDSVAKYDLNCTTWAEKFQWRRISPYVAYRLFLQYFGEVKNVTAFGHCPKNLSEAKVKSLRLLALTKKSLGKSPAETLFFG